MTKKNKKPIRIFTPNIDLLGEISNYESLMLTRSWHSIGDLELRINRYKKYTDTLQKGNIIVIGKDLHKAYKILHRQIELDENGKATENWLIIGKQLKEVANQRLVVAPSHTANDNKSGSVETVMKHYVNNHMVNPVDVRRRINQLVIAIDLLRGNNINWQSRFKNVAEELEAISLMSGIGWNVSVDYDSKKWIFDVMQGRDLSANNSAGNNPVIFSPELGNIQNMSFSDSDLNYRNVAYVAGQGEGVERRVIELGDATGLDRYELFVDARDVAEETDDEEPKPRPVADIIRDLTARGEQALAERISEQFLEGQMLTDSQFKYEVDWDLGDIITLQSKGWGVTLDSRITAVTEIYEETGFKVQAVYGNDQPTFIDKVKQSLRQFDNELLR